MPRPTVVIPFANIFTTSLAETPPSRTAGVRQPDVGIEPAHDQIWRARDTADLFHQLAVVGHAVDLCAVATLVSRPDGELVARCAVHWRRWLWIVGARAWAI